MPQCSDISSPTSVRGSWRHSRCRRSGPVRQSMPPNSSLVSLWRSPHAFLHAWSRHVPSLTCQYLNQARRSNTSSDSSQRQRQNGRRFGIGTFTNSRRPFPGSRNFGSRHSPQWRAYSRRDRRSDAAQHPGHTICKADYGKRGEAPGLNRIVTDSRSTTSS